AGRHPELVTRVVTLDNLRVPFLMSGRQKILSFRSNDWKPDPGVVPGDALCKEAGIEVVQTDAQHTEMSDRGPAAVKQEITGALEKFLDEADKVTVATTHPSPIKPGLMYAPISP